jgi:hypothetical protein
MNLTQIGLGWISRHARPVLNGFPQMSVSLNTKAGQETNAGYRRLAHRMGSAASNRNDRANHVLSPQTRPVDSFRALRTLLE